MPSLQNSQGFFWRVLLWVVEVLLSGENGVPHIGLSLSAMIETIFYGSCTLSETQRCFCKIGDGGAVGVTGMASLFPAANFKFDLSVSVPMVSWGA